MIQSIIDLVKEIIRLLSRLFDRPTRQVAKVVRIYDAMHNVLDNTGVERFLITKAHNGGGLIKAHTPLYITSLYEDYTRPLDSVKGNYQKVEVDEDFIRTLLQVTREKKVCIRVSNLKPSLLKTICDGDGIKYVEIHFLGQDKKNIYICTCSSTKEDGWGNNPSEVLTIDLAVNTIRNNIL